jgi:hypothetical protein
MATAFPLSPEEQVMGAIGAPSVGSAGPGQFSGYDLTGALQAGITPADIAQGMASQIGYRYEDARRAGVTDEQIIAGLMGENAFTAGMKQFIQAGGSSIKGIAQKLGPEGGLLNTERALAERQAADIASANNPLAGGVGYVAGSFADPIALPFGIVKGFQGVSALSTLAKQGAAQGAFAGLLEPVLTPEDSVVKNILFGTVAGAGLGAGIGKLIDKMGAKAADVVDPVKAAEDADLTKQASKTAIEDLTKAVAPEAVPVERAITGEGVMSRVASDAEVQALTTRRAQLQSEVDDLRWRQAETQQVAPQEAPQVAALLRGETPAPVNVADNLPSTSRGLFTPTREEPTQQVPALFQRPQQAAPEAPIGRAAQEAALFKGGLDNAIQTRQAEIQSINARLAEREQLIANRSKPEMVQVETKKPLDVNAPLTPAETQTIAKLQKVLDDNGFKSMDEAIVATGKPAEVAAAQARIDSGNVQTLEQIVRGFRSGGSAAVSPERLYAGTTVFPDVERAVVGATMGEKAPRLKIEPVKSEDVNKLLQDTVGFLGKDLKRMREGGDFSGTLKGTVEAGIQSARKAAAEEGSYLGWLFKEDENGNFVNIDKSWDRGEIAAFMPVVRDATNIYNRLMDEAVELNVKGDLSDEALQTIMEKMAYPIQIMGIFQAKRTQASRSLNAFKTLDSSLKEGKTVKGFMKAGTPCA